MIFRLSCCNVGVGIVGMDGGTDSCHVGGTDRWERMDVTLVERMVGCDGGTYGCDVDGTDRWLRWRYVWLRR